MVAGVIGIRHTLFELSYHTNKRYYTKLSSDNFEDYKKTLHINKLIKVELFGTE